MAYLKPQSPLQYKDGDYFYPLTTADQVVMKDGSRLNSTLGVSAIPTTTTKDNGKFLRVVDDIPSWHTVINVGEVNI